MVRPQEGIPVCPTNGTLVIYVKSILLNALTFPACSDRVATYSTLHSSWYQARKLYDSSR
jgi:hypothetical protein